MTHFIAAMLALSLSFSVSAPHGGFTARGCETGACRAAEVHCRGEAPSCAFDCDPIRERARDCEDAEDSVCPRGNASCDPDCTPIRERARDCEDAEGSACPRENANREGCHGNGHQGGRHHGASSGGRGVCEVTGK